MEKIIIATSNDNKVEEFKKLFSNLDIKIQSIKEYLGFLPIVIEDKDTFQENAEKKAFEMAQFCDDIVLADDSGLVIDALDGRPGIFSARYAEKMSCFANNVSKVMYEMRGIKTRQAKFVCVLSLALKKKGIIKSFFGEVHGFIVKDNFSYGEGFGYDPIFIANGYKKPFSEITNDEKNSISHRGKAFELLLKYIK